MIVGCSIGDNRAVSLERGTVRGIPAVIAAGKMGHVGKLGTKLGDVVVAFALPP